MSNFENQLTFMSPEDLANLESSPAFQDIEQNIQATESVKESAKKEQSVKSEHTLVLPLAGNPVNGTILPKEEKLVWSEYKRIIAELVRKLAEKGGYELIIPVRNKFDLEWLRSAEKNNLPVTFILPYQSWGDSKLPKFQTDLVRRMKNRSQNTIVIHKDTSFTGRVHQAIKDADFVIGLNESHEIEQFFGTINESGVKVRPFPIELMKYTTEEEAIEYEQSQVEASSIATADTSDVLKFG